MKFDTEIDIAHAILTGKQMKRSWWQIEQKSFLISCFIMRSNEYAKIFYQRMT